MASPLSVRSRPAATAARVAERLLELAARELDLADRPLARLAADRCLARLVDVCETLAVAAGESRASSGAGAACLRAAVLDARRGVRAVRWSLGLVHSQGAILPPSYRQLVAGLDVLSRRLDGLFRGPPHD